MAFQAFQLGDLSASRGISSLRESLVRMAQEERQRQRDAAETLRYGDQVKRQKQQDFQTAQIKANEALAAGDTQLAQSIMAPYGGQMGPRAAATSPDWAPKLNQGEIDFADTLPMNRPGAQGQWKPQETADPSLSDPNAIAESTAAADWKSTLPEPFATAVKTEKAKQQKMVDVLRGTFNGQEWSLDPTAAREASMQRADKAFYDASGEETDEAEQIREQYPQLRATYAAAGQDIDPKGVFAQFRADAAGKRAEASAMAREEMANKRMQQQWEISGLNREQSDLNNRRMTGAIGAGAKIRGASAESASNRGWNTQAEGMFKNYTASQGYSKQVEATRGYENMLADLKSGNTALMMGGLGAWVKEKSGGSAVVTENEIKRYLTSSMPWTNELERQFNYWVQGDPSLSQEYVKPFVDALEQTIVQRQRGIIDRIGKGAQATLLADENPEIRAQADGAYIRAITPLLGSDELDDFIAQRKAQTSPGEKPAAKPAKGAAAPPPPMPKSGGQPRQGGPKFQLTLADRQMAEKAQAVKPGEPLYESAQRWLKAHGL
jgi:hypothetical protein